MQDAEETEPLLAKGLYDTVRKAGDQKVPDELKIAEQLAGAGIDDDAAKSSQRASEGIKELRQGVESAAERVLGDETAALRRARLSSMNWPIRSIARSPRPRVRKVKRQSGMPDSKDQPGQGQQSGQTKQQGQQSGRRVQQEQEPGEGRQPGRQGEQGQQPGEQQKGQRPGHRVKSLVKASSQDSEANNPVSRVNNQVKLNRANNRVLASNLAGKGVKASRVAKGNKASNRDNEAKGNPARATSPDNVSKADKEVAEDKAGSTAWLRALRTIMHAVPDRGIRSQVKASASGRTGCARSRSCLTIRNYGRRPRGFATAFEASARNSNDTPKSRMRASSRDSLPSR